MPRNPSVPPKMSAASISRVISSGYIRVTMAK